MTPTERNLNIDLFNNAVLFTITLRAWGNRRKASTDVVDTTADKSRLHLTKKLLQTKELAAIYRFQRDTKDWCLKRSMPAFIRNGVYVVKLDMVEEFEKRLRAALEEQRERYIPDLLGVYDASIKDAQRELGDLFRMKDYPAAGELARTFGIEWGWVTFGVPDNLPADLRAEESAKLRQKFLDAQEEIVTALREGFGELLEYAIDRLKVEPGQKPKLLIKDVVKNRFEEFVETFNARNFLEDKDLEAVVEEARKVLSGMDMDRIKRSRGLRNRTAEAFEGLKKTVDGLIAERPSRKFSFDEDEAA